MSEIIVSPALAKHITASMKPIHDMLEQQGKQQANIAASFEPIYGSIKSMQAVAEQVSKIYIPHLPAIKQNLLAANAAYASAIANSGALDAVRQTQALAASLRMVTIDFSGLQLPNLDMSTVLEGIGQHIQAGNIPAEIIDQATEAVEELGVFFAPPQSSFTDKSIDYALQISSAKFWVWMLVFLFHLSLIDDRFDWNETITLITGQFLLESAKPHANKVFTGKLKHRLDSTGEENA